MKVLIFLTYGVSLRDWAESGLLTRELELYKIISKKYNLDFTIISYGNSEDEKFLIEVDKISVIPIYKYIKKSKYKLMNFTKTLYVPFLLRFKLKIRFDLIKTNQLWGSWVAIMLKAITFKPLHIRTGYDIFKFSIDEKNLLYKRIFYYFLTQTGLIFSNLYSVTSKSDLDYIKKYYLFSNSKLALRPNWVQVDKKFPKGTRNNKILMVGRLEKQKNFDFIIEKLKNTNLFLDIYGDGSLLEELKLKAKNIENIKFMGKVEHSELMDIYKKYSIYLSVSDYEGNSKTILEAMGSGCVVIANTIPNNTEIIENDINGILFDKEKDNIIEILKNVLYEPIKFEIISKQAYQKIANNNSLISCSSREYKDYLHMLNLKY